MAAAKAEVRLPRDSCLVTGEGDHIADVQLPSAP